MMPTCVPGISTVVKGPRANSVHVEAGSARRGRSGSGIVPRATSTGPLNVECGRYRRRQSTREQVEHPVLAEAADDQPRGRELGFALRAAGDGDRRAAASSRRQSVRATREPARGTAPWYGAPGPACRVSRGASPSRRRPRAGSPSRMRRAHRTSDHQGGTARQVVSRGCRRGSGGHTLRRSGRGVRAPRAHAPECRTQEGCSVARGRARATR